MNAQPRKLKTATVIGGGTMGTALAQHLCNIGCNTRMWVYEAPLVSAINERHENDLFLPGIPLSSRLTATNDLENALSESDLVLSVTPSQVLRQVWTNARPYVPNGIPIVCASKGIETGTGKLISEVFADVLGDHAKRVAFLSGPSFAREMLDGQPTAMVVASSDLQLATAIQEAISTPLLRAYTTDDVVGVEMGGALKNVIAIAVGAAEGIGLGINARSALITRGLAEITRLAVARGANPLTLAGLAGMGDLVLTCNGQLSRNLQVGQRLGKGESLAQIERSMTMVAEGVATARSALALARTVSVEVPIIKTVVELLSGQTTPDDAVANLMGRRLRSEKEH